jgi:thioredoxin-dependent peroxiredoxin
VRRRRGATGSLLLPKHPCADTSGCTTQACGIRDRRADCKAAGVRVVGISPDPVDAVAKFAAKHGLDFTLLADADHAVADAYGTWVEKRNYGKSYWGVQRSMFIIDPEGTIAHVIERAPPKTPTTTSSRRWRTLRRRRRRR